MRIDEAPLQALSAAQRAALQAMDVPVYLRRRLPAVPAPAVSIESMPEWSPEDWRLPVTAALARALRVSVTELRKRLDAGELRLPPPAQWQGAVARRALWRQLRSGLRSPR